MADRADAELGGRRQVMKGGFPTRKAAEAALADYLSKAGRGELLTSDTRRLADYLAEWLTGIRLTLAVAAWTNYRSVLNLYVTPRIGQLRLTAITGPALTALYADLLDHGGQKGRCLSPTTVRLVHRVLTKAFNDAVEARVLAANPAQRAKVPARHQIDADVERVTSCRLPSGNVRGSTPCRLGARAGVRAAPR